jgi:hypothetical protein
MDAGVDDLPVLHVFTGDSIQFPVDIAGSGEDIDTCRFHAGADKVHMPAFPPETFINDTFGLLGNTVLVLAPDAGIPPNPNAL